MGEICSRVQGNDGRMELPTLTISAGNGWMNQEDRFSGNIAGKEQKNYTLLKKGELSYNHGNSKLAKYGTVFSLQTYEEALVPRVYHSFKVEKGNANFVEYYFATKLPDRELGKLISSGARMDGLLNIGYDDFMGISLLLPKTQEQDCIAGYFRKIDMFITLHQCKCHLLLKLLHNDWEQRKFGDDNDLITGYPFESEKFSEEGIKLVRGMNVKRGYLDFSNDICMRWNSTDGLENYLLEADDILIQMDGALIGKSYAKIAEEQLPALLVQRVTRARTRSKDACTDFMYQTIQRDFLRYIGMNKTETAVPHLSLNDIYNFKIMVPCLEEQQQIGAYFSNIDNLITLHHRKYIYILKSP